MTINIKELHGHFSHSLFSSATNTKDLASVAMTTNWDLDEVLSRELIANGTLLIPELTNLVFLYLTPIAMLCESVFNAMSIGNVATVMLDKDKWLEKQRLAVYCSINVRRGAHYNIASESWTIVARLIEPIRPIETYIVFSSVSAGFYSQNVFVRHFETLKQAVDSLDGEQQQLFRTFQQEYCKSRQFGKVCFLLRNLSYDIQGKLTLNYQELQIHFHASYLNN